MIIEITYGGSNVTQRVGIREAKAQFSRLLDVVKGGGEVVITERGRPIARLAQIGKDQLGVVELEQLMERAGQIAPRTAAPRTPPLPLPIGSDAAARFLRGEER